MCGIAGVISLAHQPVPQLPRVLDVMNRLQAHRGPDGHDTWQHPDQTLGFAHQRLSIIDLSTGDQPMTDRAGNWIVFNGEIYNYIELRVELGLDQFVTHSDTEVILLAYRKWGRDCVNHLRGMFAFALWDESAQALFCARDRFGIKPFYFTQVGTELYFSSETKTLLPFVDRIETDLAGLKDYLVFQFCLSGKTLFAGISELQPAHWLWIADGQLQIHQYWEVAYNLDFDHTEKYFTERLEALMHDSIAMHLRADVPLGSYLSGGLDSSIVATLAAQYSSTEYMGFVGKFTYGAGFDESHHARAVADQANFALHEIDITVQDFIDNMRQVIYHLDFPVAGPGSFPQFMVSRMARQHRKVVLGGQGGDEIFGGYTRYLIAYFEQCIKAAIDGTAHNGNFIVTYESIIPNLTALRQYKPMMQEFWREGLFDDPEKRYFRLVNRAPQLGDEIDWRQIDGYSSYQSFLQVWQGKTPEKRSYFDNMTRFDFKTLLPALLQVEDRVSMAHGLESRVPFLDHPLVEFAATIPSNVKFKDGQTKHALKQALSHVLPDSVANRTDKMGFPVPLNEWMRGPAREFVREVFTSQKALTRGIVDNRRVVEKLDHESKFGRTLWGLLSLELWQQTFHDCAHEYKAMMRG